MRVEIQDNIALAEISPLALFAYVRAQGWSRVGRYGENSIVLAKEGAPEVILPTTDGVGDYVSVVRTLISIFSRYENRGELQVYRDLVGADKDTIRLRAPSGEENGSIDLNRGLGFIKGSYDLLLSAACAANKKEVRYQAGKIKRANGYMENVQLGQTEQGSFIVTLLAPVPPSLELDQTNMWPDRPREPFERVVTYTFVEALRHARLAASAVTGGEGMMAFYSAVRHGVSANLCEALADLVDMGGGFDVSLTWAKTRPLDGGLFQESFDKKSGAIFREAARAFIELEPRHDEFFTGVVFRLKREPHHDRGTIGLRIFLDGQPTSVTARVSDQLYHVAVTANDERAVVEVHGDLKRVGQRWHIDPIYDLAIVRDSFLDAMMDDPDDSLQ